MPRNFQISAVVVLFHLERPFCIAYLLVSRAISSQRLQGQSCCKYSNAELLVGSNLFTDPSMPLNVGYSPERREALSPSSRAHRRFLDVGAAPSMLSLLTGSSPSESVLYGSSSSNWIEK